ASASTRSKRSPAPSSSSPVRDRMRGSRPATMRGVNVALTSRRSARCSGGASWVSMPGRTGAAAGGGGAVSGESAGGGGRGGEGRRGWRRQDGLERPAHGDGERVGLRLERDVGGQQAFEHEEPGDGGREAVRESGISGGIVGEQAVLVQRRVVRRPERVLVPA